MAYFGEKTTKACGICSVCISKKSEVKTTTKTSVSNHILKALETEPLSSRQLLQTIKCSENALLQSLSELIEVKKIKITQANTYTLI